MKIIKGEDLKGMEFVEQEDGTLKVYKRKGRFIPKENEPFWIVETDGEIAMYLNRNDSYSLWMINHNLVFRTEKECEDYKWFLEMLNKYKHDFSYDEWENLHVSEYYLYYVYTNKTLYVCNDWASQDMNKIYFKKGNAEKFINEVGEDKIKKYMFDVWE